MAVAIPVLLAVSTAVSTVMAVQGARQARKQRNAQAAIEDQNRLLQEKQTRIQLAQHDREQRLRLGSLKAKAGGQGRGLAGNVLDIIGDTVAQGFLERKYIAESGGIKAENYSRSADALRSQGKAESRTGYLNAANTLLGGAAGTIDAFQRVN